MGSNNCFWQITSIVSQLTKWTVVEALLLDENLHIKGSPFLRDLARGFNRSKKVQYFEEDGIALPSHLTIDQLLFLFQGDLALTLEQLRSLQGIMQQYHIIVLGDLCSETNEWCVMASFKSLTSNSCHGDDLGLSWFLGIIAKLAPPVDGGLLQNKSCWFWRIGEKEWKSCSLPNTARHSLVASPKLTLRN